MWDSLGDNYELLDCQIARVPDVLALLLFACGCSLPDLVPIAVMV